MESMTLRRQNPASGILPILFAVFLLTGTYHLINATGQYPCGAETVSMHGDAEWGSLSADDLPALEAGLERRLEQVYQGLPLTSAQMQKLQELYGKLMENGGTASIHGRIIQLIRDMVVLSGMTEVSLEHYQNAKNQSDDIQGMDGQRGN